MYDVANSHKEIVSSESFKATNATAQNNQNG